MDTSERRQHAFSNAADVRAQIREREQARIGERNAFFEEGAKLDEEARQRRQRLEEVKRKKLDELRWAERAALAGAVRCTCRRPRAVCMKQRQLAYS